MTSLSGRPPLPGKEFLVRAVTVRFSLPLLVRMCGTTIRGGQKGELQGRQGGTRMVAERNRLARRDIGRDGERQRLRDFALDAGG